MILDRGGDTAPKKRSSGCRELVFGRDAEREQLNRSRTVMAASTRCSGALAAMVGACVVVGEASVGF